MYVVDKEHPLRFLRNNRSLSSVLSKSCAVEERFYQAHGTEFATPSVSTGLRSRMRSTSSTCEMSCPRSRPASGRPAGSRLSRTKRKRHAVGVVTSSSELLVGPKVSPGKALSGVP
jgi:hypothetical protein